MCDPFRLAKGFDAVADLALNVLQFIRLLMYPPLSTLLISRDGKINLRETTNFAVCAPAACIEPDRWTTGAGCASRPISIHIKHGFRRGGRSRRPPRFVGALEGGTCPTEDHRANWIPSQNPPHCRRSCSVAEERRFDRRSVRRGRLGPEYIVERREQVHVIPRRSQSHCLR